MPFESTETERIKIKECTGSLVIKEDGWLDLSTFLDCFIYPQNWRLLCEQCLGNYSEGARNQVQFRFIEYQQIVVDAKDVGISMDVGCIYRSTTSAADSMCGSEGSCSYDTAEGIDIVYAGHDITTRVSLFEIVVIRPDQSIEYKLSPGIYLGVLMRVPSQFRFARGDTSSCSNSTISSLSLIPDDLKDQLSIDGQEMRNGGLFGCNARRKERTCTACGACWFRRMPKCGRCQKTRYCSQICQRRAWKEHKRDCHRARSSGHSTGRCSSAVDEANIE